MSHKAIGLLFLFSVFFVNLTFSQSTSVKYTIKNLNINSKSSDYGTSFFGPNRVYFASNKDATKGVSIKALRETQDAPSYDLFKGIVNQSGEIEYVEKIQNFDNDYNQSNASFTPDMKFVYFTQNNIVNGKTVGDKKGNVNMKIYRANVKPDGKWENIISLPFNSDFYSCAHPSVSEDGKVLFFSSDMPGTYGSSDIYWVTISDDGIYGKPYNMGNNINSKYRESFPYVDKNILYFSSDKEGSEGGLDVYYVQIDEPDSKPINLGQPINSKFDDFCFVIDRENKKGFFSSNRPGGKGSDDIYFFKQETDFVDCKQVVEGQILDSKSLEPIAGAIVAIYSHENILISTFPVKENGDYKFELACRGNYRVQASHFEYNNSSKDINFTPQIFTQRINLLLDPNEKAKPEIVLDEKVKEKEVEIVEENPIKEENTEVRNIGLPTIIRNGREVLDLPIIYFELDSYYLTKEAERIVNEAIGLMKLYPNISIEFASHTDSRASDSYNLHLSDLRAKEVLEFMLKRGISRSRIVGRGYGESKPVNNCVDGVKCSEQEHLQNRRAEFVIIKK